MRRLLAVLLSLLAVASAAACGGGGGDSGDANDVASEPAAQVVVDAAAALRQVESFHVEATDGSGRKETFLKADVGLPSKLRLEMKRRAASASIVLVDSSLYIKANASFWRDEANAGDAAAQLAGRWLKTPAESKDLRDLTEELDPERLSRCLLRDHGTLSKRGTATVGGEEAVVIADKGDRPGTAPGRLYVAARGDPLPLRVVATGDERPGGKKDPQCDSDDGSPTQAGDEVTFSRYDEPLDIAAPPDAVDLDSPGVGTAS